jgi:hypothetical protein
MRVEDNWGRCTVEVTRDFLIFLLTYPREDLRILKASWIGDMDYYLCEVASPKLAPGYNYVMNIVLNCQTKEFYFKRDMDT